MVELGKVLYEDPRLKVVVGSESVVFTSGEMAVFASHAEMREIMLAWERHELREKE